jgi:hypothetical protein
MNEVEMVRESQNVTPEEIAHIMSLEKVVQKLGDIAPSASAKGEEEDHEEKRKYVRNVISAAKKNSSLFSQEEMGHVLAADFLMQATTSDEENKALALKAETAPTPTALPKIDPKLDAALKVVAAVVKNSSSYQDALRAGVIALEECIPYVGGIVAAMTTVFWSENKKSVWDQVKDQVNRVVQNAIFENEYNVVKSQITAVRTSLNQYVNSPNNTEQGNILIATMVLMNSLYERVNQSNNRHMLIGLMVPIGSLHLTVLSERYNHYKVLFGQDDRTEALKELESTYTQYKVFFDSVYVEWKNWRSSELDVFYKSERILWDKVYSYGVSDGLGLYNFGYEIDDRSRASEFKEWAINRSIADMADVLSGTQSYSTFFKDINVTLSSILSELDTLVLGPYLWTRFQDTGNMNNTMIGGWTSDTPSGEVNRINIYAYNSIDGLQFIYPDKAGTKVTSGGGASFELDLEGKQCVGAKLNYSSGLVYEIQFFFADGSKSPVYGNKGGWSSIASADATVGGAYKLAFGNFALGSGPSGTTGINGVVFTYKRV